MTDRSHIDGDTTVVMNAEAVQTAIHRLAQEIVAENVHIEKVALLGILTRGRPLASRLATEIKEMTGQELLVGSLSTQMYRDDLRSGRIQGITGDTGTHFDFDVNGLNVVIVDDVLSTGRTIRAALDEIMDYGRPCRVQLACLVDRGLRELPIRPDFLGWACSTSPADHVTVKLHETDGEDAVLIERGVYSQEAEEDKNDG